jgi:6-phosphogluconate dehydrogenase
MPGGSPEAWPAIKPIFQAIAAKVGPKNDIPCCEWVGPRGAGHYVKMVHNGIEYGDMQLICEAYFLMREVLGLSNDELYEVFADWNHGELNSYLIEITRDIFSVDDAETGDRLVDKVLDRAGAKGTGKWMSQLALDLGMPSTLVTEAVFARCLTALKEDRAGAGRVLQGPTPFDKPCTRRKFAAMRRVLSNCGRRPRRTSGRSITATSPCCGEEGASFGPCFSTGSRRRSTPTRRWRTCCWRRTSRRP